MEQYVWSNVRREVKLRGEERHSISTRDGALFILFVGDEGGVQEATRRRASCSSPPLSYQRGNSRWGGRGGAGVGTFRWRLATAHGMTDGKAQDMQPGALDPATHHYQLSGSRQPAHFPRSWHTIYELYNKIIQFNRSISYYNSRATDRTQWTTSTPSPRT